MNEILILLVVLSLALLANFFTNKYLKTIKSRLFLNFVSIFVIALMLFTSDSKNKTPFFILFISIFISEIYKNFKLYKQVK